MNILYIQIIEKNCKIKTRLVSWSSYNNSTGLVSCGEITLLAFETSFVVCFMGFLIPGYEHGVFVNHWNDYCRELLVDTASYTACTTFNSHWNLSGFVVDSQESQESSLCCLKCYCNIHSMMKWMSIVWAVQMLILVSDL